MKSPVRPISIAATLAAAAFLIISQPAAAGGGGGGGHGGGGGGHGGGGGGHGGGGRHSAFGSAGHGGAGSFRGGFGRHWPGVFWGGVGLGIGVGALGYYGGYYDDGYYAPYYGGYYYDAPVIVGAPVYGTVEPGAATRHGQPVPPVAAPADPIFYPRNDQSAELTESDWRACTRWATTQRGAMADASIFQRATFACMEGRGYTVK